MDDILLPGDFSCCAPVEKERCMESSALYMENKHGIKGRFMQAALITHSPFPEKEMAVPGKRLFFDVLPRRCVPGRNAAEEVKELPV